MFLLTWVEKSEPSQRRFVEIYGHVTGGVPFPVVAKLGFVDAHPIMHWPDGGETSVENLVLLCFSHHKLVREGEYSISRDHEQDLFFWRPDGKAVPSGGICQGDWTDEDGTEEA